MQNRRFSLKHWSRNISRLVDFLNILTKQCMEEVAPKMKIMDTPLFHLYTKNIY